MPIFQQPIPKDEYCKYPNCGLKLNHYGVCPNYAKHRNNDTIMRQQKEEKQRNFQELLDNIFCDNGGNT